MEAHAGATAATSSEPPAAPVPETSHQPGRERKKGPRSRVPLTPRGLRTVLPLLPNRHASPSCRPLGLTDSNPDVQGILRVLSGCVHLPSHYKCPEVLAIVTLAPEHQHPHHLWVNRTRSQEAALAQSSSEGQRAALEIPSTTPAGAARPWRPGLMAHSEETADVTPISVWRSREMASSHRNALLCAMPCSL